MVLLKPEEHALIRPHLVERTASRIRPLTRHGARNAKDRADADLDARLLAIKIVDEILGVMTGEAPVKREASDRFADLVARVAR